MTELVPNTAELGSGHIIRVIFFTIVTKLRVTCRQIISKENWELLKKLSGHWVIDVTKLREPYIKIRPIVLLFKSFPPQLQNFYKIDFNTSQHRSKTHGPAET